MGKYKILFHAAVEKQKKSMAGIAFLMFVAAVCLFTSLILSESGTVSVTQEMERLGFGMFTAWVSGDGETAAGEIKSLPDVEEVTVQPLIFAGYEVNGKHSDDEGQLLVPDEVVPYRFISERGESVNDQTIERGNIYISPAMKSGFDVKIGDRIRFEFSRAGEKRSKEFTVAGFFADGFMGSSMIDMKSFLISGEDRKECLEILSGAAEYDRLGEVGAMLHVFQKEDSGMTVSDFQKQVLTETELPLYTKFTYGFSTIASYMLLLQNILTGFLLTFSGVLLLVTLLVISHSLSSVIEQDRGDIAAFKMIGLSGNQIRAVYLEIYGGALLFGFLAGLLVSVLLAGVLAKNMVSSTGMLTHLHVPIVPVVLFFLGLLAAFALFLLIQTARIIKITPMLAIREAKGSSRVMTGFHKNKLSLWLALREVLAGKKRYVGIFLISFVLVMFLGIVDRMAGWVGLEGEGLMNAFSVADHDLGVQPMNQTVPMDEIERVIEWYSPIQETYELAMQPVTVNGQAYTANVLRETEYFHLLKGSVCGGNEILITDTVAEEQGLSVGDRVQVAGEGRMEEYTVSGIYQCANGMGNNIGMSIAGYSKIGDVTGYIWCRHYILENGMVKDYAMKYLQESYSGIDVHTNSWSGLDGIVRVMHLLTVALYVLSVVFIVVTVAMAAGKLLQAETGTLAVYKSLGISTGLLRCSFAFRFLLVVMAGAVLGGIATVFGADPLITAVFRRFGIGEFSAGSSPAGTILPIVVVPAVFTVSAWLFSAKVSRVSIKDLISENEKGA